MINIDYYELTNLSNTRTITITFPGGIDVVMSSPLASVATTYRVFDLIVTYIDDLPAQWTAGVTKVFETTPTPTRPSIRMRRKTFPESVREIFDKIAKKEDIRDNRERNGS